LPWAAAHPNGLVDAGGGCGIVGDIRSVATSGSWGRTRATPTLQLFSPQALEWGSPSLIPAVCGRMRPRQARTLAFPIVLWPGVQPEASEVCQCPPLGGAWRPLLSPKRQYLARSDVQRSNFFCAWLQMLTNSSTKKQRVLNGSQRVIIIVVAIVICIIIIIVIIIIIIHIHIRIQSS
jgi:hypothetical protein